MSGRNGWWLGGSLLALLAGLLAFSCADETTCAVCDDKAEESAAAAACGDLVKAMTACEIELSELTAEKAATSCEQHYGQRLAECYFDCYRTYSRCSFWTECVRGCENDYGQWADPDAATDAVAECTKAYLWMYDQCAMAFTDEDGHAIDREKAIAWCIAGKQHYGDDYLQCILDFYGICDNTIHCLLTL